MGMERRRAGFRLSWTANDQHSEDEGQPDEAATETTPAAVDTMTADAAGGETPSGATPSGETTAPETEPTVAADGAEWPATPADSPATPEGESSEFLVSLVGAMRGVAESSRDASLADLRTTVDAHVEQLSTTSAEKETDLRRAADLDLQGVGEWEHNEIERIKSEAETRRDARRTKLDQQLAEHRVTSEREVEAARARLADYERELAGFFAQLAEISDPAAFVAAAKRLPQAPDLSSPPTAAAPSAEKDASSPTDDLRMAAMGATDEPTAESTATAETVAESDAESPAEASSTETVDATTDNRLAARLAQLDQRIAGGTLPVAAVAPAASANGGEMSTAIIVKGLGSFGAITSFKQALERVDGVRGVTLSLGPTGEFVYRASHAADFDMVAAVQSVEGPSATVDDTDGTLVVTLSRAR